jgi:hypothetical protein
MDSPTKKQDVIYLQPINGDDPLFPNNWTEEEKKIYFEWNELAKQGTVKGKVKSIINAAYEF